MRSFVRLLVTALFSTALAGMPCLAQTVTVDYDHSLNLDKYQTYSWSKIHTTDPSMVSRVSIALNRTLRGKQMTEKSSGSDITIAVVEASESKQELVDHYSGLSGFLWQRGWGSGGFLDSPAKIQEIPLGALVVDFYDTKTHKLLWRGLATDTVVKNGDKYDQKIDKAINDLVGKFPPKYVKK